MEVQIPPQPFFVSFCFSAGNFLFSTWAFWTSIRQDQSGVNIVLKEDIHRVEKR